MKYTTVPFVGGFYADETRAFSVQDCVNYLPEQAESPGTRTPEKLKTPPGLNDLIPVNAINITGTYPEGFITLPYSSDLTITGGYGVYTNLSLISGTLPPGLSLSLVGNKIRLSGTPTGTGALYSLIISVDSIDGLTGTTNQSLRINSALPVTFDPLWKYSTVALSNNNYTATGTDDFTQAGVYGLIGQSTGKWFYECQITGNAYMMVAGIADKSTLNSGGDTRGSLSSFVGSANGPGNDAGVRLLGQLSNTPGVVDISYFYKPTTTLNSEAHGTGALNDRFGVAADFDLGTVSFYKNGVLLSTKTIFVASTYYPAVTVGGIGAQMVISKPALYPIEGYRQWLSA